MSEEQKPFIAGTDRPQVGVHPDTPISELRVRDLTDILGAFPVKPVVSEGVGKVWKERIKEVIKEYIDLDVHKLHKDIKDRYEVFIPIPPLIPDPIGPISGVDELVRAVTDLRQQVNQMSGEIARLKQGGQS